MTTVQILVIAVAFIVAGMAKGAIGMGMPPIAHKATPDATSQRKYVFSKN